MDKTFRSELLAVVSRAVATATSQNTEVWLSSEALCEHFAMFTPAWLKKYGHLLPRTRAEVTEEDGSVHVTRWAYPRNKIQYLITSNKIKQL